MITDFNSARRVLADFAKTMMWASAKFPRRTPEEYIAERRLILALDDLRVAIKKHNADALADLVGRAHHHFNEYWEELMKRFGP